jgi:hypothetical protein
MTPYRKRMKFHVGTYIYIYIIAYIYIYMYVCLVLRLRYYGLRYYLRCLNLILVLANIFFIPIYSLLKNESNDSIR